MPHDGPEARMSAPDISDLRRELAALQERNTRLTATFHEARGQIVAMKEEIDRLAQPPAGYGLFLEAFDDGTVDVFTERSQAPRRGEPRRRARRAAAWSRSHAERSDERGARHGL